MSATPYREAIISFTLRFAIAIGLYQLLLAKQPLGRGKSPEDDE